MTATDELTERQQAVLDCIRAYWSEHGCPPTYRDIMQAMGFSSTNGVTCHLEPLAVKGVIELQRDGASRGIMLPGLRKVIADAIKKGMV